MSTDERLKRAIFGINVTAHGPTEIDLGHANFGDAHMIKLCPYVARNCIVTDLNLASNVFADDGARALARAIRKNTTLKKLDIRDNLIGNDGCMALISALRDNTSLTTVDLPGNRIGDNAIVDLSRALSECDDDDDAIKVATLRIGNNPFTTYGASELIKAFSNAETHSNKIMKLDLSKSSLGQNHGVLFGEILENNFYLEELVLDFNNLIDVGVKAIAKGIHANKHQSKLTYLSLASNNITDEGASTLMKYTSRNLENLNLTMNKVTCAGSESHWLFELLEHMREQKKKHDVSLSFNEIDLSHNLINNEQDVQELKKYSELLDFRFMLYGNLGIKTGLRFPTGIVKKFKAKKVLKNPGAKGGAGGGGEPEYIIEYVEDTADEQEKIKNERAYFNILNKTIKNATVLQEMRAEDFRKDPYDSKRLYMRRHGDIELHRAKNILAQSRIARRAGKSGPWDGDNDADWEED